MTRARVRKTPTPPGLDSDALHGCLLGRPVAGDGARTRAAQKYAARVSDAGGTEEASLLQAGLRQQAFLGDEGFVACMQALASTEQRSAGHLPKAQRKLLGTLQECPRRIADRSEALRMAYRACGITMTAMAKELRLSVSRVGRLIAVAEGVGGGLGGKRQHPEARDPEARLP